jgi:uncharacterized protein
VPFAGLVEIAPLSLALLALRRLWIAAEMVAVSGRVPPSVAFPIPIAFLVDVLGAAVVAFFLSGVHSPRLGVRVLLRWLNPGWQQVRWYWWAIAVGVYPAVLCLGNAISTRVGLPVQAPKAAGLWYWLALDGLIMFLFVMIGGGGLEEPGWRGFCLPLLQKRHSPLRSSLILAVIWAFWHWPMFWFGFYEGGPLGVLFYLIGVAPVTILFTAVFNQTRGSLPIVILLHTSINKTPIYLPASTLSASLWVLLILVVAYWMWRSPRTFAYCNPQAASKQTL